MKQYATAFLTLLLLAFFSAVPAAHAQPAYQQGVSQNTVIDGVFSVKFDASATAAVETSMNGRGTLTQKDAQGVPQTGLASVDQLSKQYGVTQMQRIFRPAGKFEARHRRAGLHRWYTVRLPKSASLQSAVQAYNADPNVTVAEFRLKKDYSDGYKPGKTHARRVDAPRAGAVQNSAAQNGPESNQAIPNDPMFGAQWHYNNTGQTPPGGTPDADIDLPEAYNIESGNAQVIVSVHDGGIDVDHEDLQANVWINEDEIPGNGEDDDNNGFVDDYHGYNFAEGQGEIDAMEHGTHTSGTVAAVTGNGVGVAGVAGGDGAPESGVRVMSVQIFGPTDNNGFAEGYSYAADNDAVISQNSWGYTSEGFFEQAVLDGIDYYVANAGSTPDAPMQGGLVVFSAGNTSGSGTLYPGFYNPTIAVASTNINDQKSGYSSYGTWVDVSAPGGNGLPFDENDVLSTIPNDGYGYLAGTSMAAPHTSGVIALIVSAAPGLTNDRVREQIESTTDDISDINPGFEDQIGTGRINAFNAVSTLDVNDDTPPAAIDDLAALLASGGNNAELTWTAVGDDGVNPDSGAVAAYQVAYSADGPITDSTSFADATLAPVSPAPAEPGTEQGTIVEDLDFDTEYWFAVKALDDNANTSLSNSPSVTTNPAPELAYSPDTLSAEIDAGADTTLALTLENTGPGITELNFSFPAFAAEDVLASTPARQHNDVSRPGQQDVSYAKDQPDPYSGAGRPVTLGAGGPDAFGYEWIDSNEPGGPTFNFFDISDVGTAVNLSDDDGQSVDLPFVLEFYDASYTEVSIGSNGYLTLGGGDATEFSNAPIPDGGAPNGLIAPFWDDLDPSSGGTIHYYEDADDDRFIVQYTDVPEYSFSGDGDTYTFQVIINDDGSFLFQYDDVEGGGDLTSATVGLENEAGDVGLQVAYNTSYVEDGLAVALAAAPDFITAVQPASGTIAGGASQTVDVTFDATEIDESGLFEDDLTVETNDPGSQIVAIPAEALVSTGPPNIAARPSTLDFGAVPTNQTTIDSFYVANEGGEPLEVSNITLSGDTDAFDVGVFPPAAYPISVPVGDSSQVNVSFEPSDTTTAYTATATVQSNDPDGDASTVTLTGEGAAEQASVVFNDQPSGGLTVTVDSTILPADGYVAIHDSTLLGDDGTPFTEDDQPLSSVIGVSEFLSEGTYSDVEVTLFDVPGKDFPADTTLFVDQTLIAMPHEETSGNEVYNFITSSGAEDGPFVDENGNAIVDLGFVDVTSVPVVINEVFANVPDAGGDANADGTTDASDDEFVELANVGDEPVDLGGYTLSTDAGTRHTFPAGTVLNPGVGAVVFGGGTPGAFPGATQTASEGSLDLGDDGDTVTLLDGDGATAAAVTYGAEGPAPSPEGEALARDPDFSGAFVAHTAIDRDGDSSADGLLFTPGLLNAQTGALPVEFDGAPQAQLDDADVVLHWSTLSENGNAGFQVQQRAPDASSFENLAGTFVESDAPGGTSTQELQYSARLEDLAPGRHTLRLKQVDIDDQTSFSGTVEVEVPAHFALSAPYPNPFDESTQIDLTVPKAQHVTASVYNVLGQRVQVLFDERVEVSQTLRLRASSLASGLYLIRVEGDTFQEVRQVTLVR